MRVSRLTIDNFRGISHAELHFAGHVLMVGGNNVGKSTICEALDLVLSPDRLSKSPVVEEFDFRNATYLAGDGTTPVPIRIEVVLTDLSDEVQRLCKTNLEFWHKAERRILGEGEIRSADNPDVEHCLRLVTLAFYDAEEDEFTAKTVYGHDTESNELERGRIPRPVKKSFGFLYLRALRTASRALSLERGSLLDMILGIKEARTGLWERIRARLSDLDPPIDEHATELRPILDQIEARLGEYIPTSPDGRATRLFVSQLTREHLRKTIAFFLSTRSGEAPVPFRDAGMGTLNTLVLALLTFIADLKKDNVIFAMEEPEIALPPYTQRRIANYLLTETTQCFVTSHSPYVIERFDADGIVRLSRDNAGVLTGTPVKLPENMKAKTYRTQLRRSIAEAMLGQGVIVGEGITEQLMLTAAAKKMEEADATLFPLDLAGVAVVNTGGDGNLSSLGGFFKSLGITAYAFYDQKDRKAAEVTAIDENFTSHTQIPYRGAEDLLAAETPLDRQWEFLEQLRAEDAENPLGLPATRPEDAMLRDTTVAALKGLKGEGGAARLLELCAVEELPSTIVNFLTQVYVAFPRPTATTVEAAPADAGTETPPAVDDVV